MAEVFISYSQKQRTVIAPFAARLAELGVEAWYDHKVPSGRSFSTFIHENLKEAKAVLTCWSPDAIKSDWVKGEADYAREQGTYVPVFVVPCKLLPPFNQIQTEDLSRWQGEASDPAWIKVVDSIAELISRDGVAAAARVQASGDEQAAYDFARRYPDEPAARKIWEAAEARHRERFERRMTEARSAVKARIEAERAAVDARLGEAAQAFEVWLENDRSGAAKEPPRDPLNLIGPVQHGEDQRLREENSALQTALAQAKAKAKANELGAAKAEIARLSDDVAALKTREALEPTEHAEEQRLHDEIINLRRALNQEKVNAAGLMDAAKAEAAELSIQLAGARAARSRAWALAAFIGLVAAGTGTLIERSAQGDVAALADLQRESDGLKAQAKMLSDDLASERDSLAAADKKQTETQGRSDSLAKQLEDLRARASNPDKDLSAVGVAPIPEYSPASPPGKRRRLLGTSSE